MNSQSTSWLAGIVFAVTYLGLALGKLPGLRIDRAGIALVGATLMIVVGALSLPQAAQAVDYRTILLLFGMMIVVGFLRLAGFFARLAHWTLSRLRGPHRLLAATIVLSGVLSAFLVNDVVCLALTPLVLHITRRLGLNPLPQLIGLATAANIGSTATITGNPQNMIIGTRSGIPYVDFLVRLGPIAVIGFLIDFLVIAVVYRKALGAGQQTEPARLRRPLPPPRPAQQWLLVKSVLVTLTAIGLFFTSAPIALVALGAAAALLLGRVRPEKVYRQVDWGLLVMFTGLFVVVRGFELHVVHAWGIEHWSLLFDHPVTVLSAASAALSNLLSNVPAVLLFVPVIEKMPPAAHETAWLVLAMSSTLAGNLTILGSVANLIVVEGARREGVDVSFGEYFWVGIPVTVLTLLVGVVWLRWVG